MTDKCFHSLGKAHFHWWKGIYLPPAAAQTLLLGLTAADVLTVPFGGELDPKGFYSDEASARHLHRTW